MYVSAPASCRTSSSTSRDPQPHSLFIYFSEFLVCSKRDISFNISLCQILCYSPFRNLRQPWFSIITQPIYLIGVLSSLPCWNAACSLKAEFDLWKEKAFAILILGFFLQRTWIYLNGNWHCKAAELLKTIYFITRRGQTLVDSKITFQWTHQFQSLVSLWTDGCICNS